MKLLDLFVEMRDFCYVGAQKNVMKDMQIKNIRKASRLWRDPFFASGHKLSQSQTTLPPVHLRVGTRGYWYSTPSRVDHVVFSSYGKHFHFLGSKGFKSTVYPKASLFWLLWKDAVAEKIPYLGMVTFFSDADGMVTERVVA